MRFAIQLYIRIDIKDKAAIWQPVQLQDGNNFGMIIFWSIHCGSNSFDVFAQDYIEAWNQRGNKIVHVFRGKQHHEMRIQVPNLLPFEPAWNDEEFLRVLKVHYGVFRGRKGFVAKLAPKTLACIAVVKVPTPPPGA
jgi:hypothetical protein